jgi:hypothetical protein
VREKHSLVAAAAAFSFLSFFILLLLSENKHRQLLMRF